MRLPNLSKFPIIFIGIIIAIIWLLGPYISIDNVKPLVSVRSRFLLTAIISLLALLYYFIQLFLQYRANAMAEFKKQMLYIFERFKFYLQVVGQFFMRLFNRARGKVYENKQSWDLHKQPWYLLFGASASGKSTTMLNSGLSFIPTEKLGKEALKYREDFPDYDWWYSDDGILIDVKRSLVSQEKDGTEASAPPDESWKQFLRLLKKRKKHKPVSGIVLHVNLIDLLHKDNSVRQNELYNTCLHIRELHNEFKMQVPVYLVFTKCDLIEGFVEFFNDMSREELAQIWGMTFPLSVAGELPSVTQAFQQEYHILMQRLQNQVLTKIDIEKNQHRREVIHAFPQQMILLKKPIENLIHELFGGVRYMNAVQLRGVYFTSASQVGNPHNVMATVYAKKYHVNHVMQAKALRQTQNGYFLSSLYRDLIFKDAPVLGYSQQRRRLRKFFYTGISYSLPVFLIGFTYAAYRSYDLNTIALAKTQESIEQYQQAALSLPINARSVDLTLPSLNALSHVVDVYNNPNNSWFMGLLPASHRTQDAANQALERGLDTLFLPRIAIYLQSKLMAMDESEINILYADLKAYLAFSPVRPTAADSLTAPMLHAWKSTYKNDNLVRESLTDYLDLALQQKIEPLPLNRKLIDHARRILAQILPVDRAYGLLILKTATSSLADLNFTHYFSAAYNHVFNASEDIDTISALYTNAGFQGLFKQDAVDIVDQVAEDNIAIGLTSMTTKQQSNEQIQVALDKKYSQLYINTWNNYLQQLQIVKFNDFTEAANTLDLLANQQSILSALLANVEENTFSITGDNIIVADHFSDLNAYMKDDKKELTIVLKQLIALKTYLTKIDQTANKSEAGFLAAKAYMQGDLDNPLKQLSLTAETAPQPLRRWLMQIVDYSWQLIQVEALRYLDGVWQDKVWPEYNTYLKGRYPLNPNGKNQISLEAFSHFFSTQGRLAKFFDDYLVLFIDTKQAPWALYRMNQHDLGLSKDRIALFERAANIRQNYFGQDQTIPAFNYSVKSRMLDSDVASIDLSIGSETLRYKHGPVETINLSWPSSKYQTAIDVSMIDFGNERYSRKYSGPWSLFKLLSNGNLRADKQTGQYLFNVTLNRQKATFELDSTANLSMLRLSSIKGFSLPAHLYVDKS